MSVRVKKWWLTILRVESQIGFRQCPDFSILVGQTYWFEDGENFKIKCIETDDGVPTCMIGVFIEQMETCTVEVQHGEEWIEATPGFCVLPGVYFRANGKVYHLETTRMNMNCPSEQEEGRSDSV